MKLEIKQPDQPKEPVAKLWLEQKCANEVCLMRECDGERTSLAFFDMGAKTFHVFEADLKIIGYTLTSN